MIRSRRIRIQRNDVGTDSADLERWLRVCECIKLLPGAGAARPVHGWERPDTRHTCQLPYPACSCYTQTKNKKNVTTKTLYCILVQTLLIFKNGALDKKKVFASRKIKALIVRFLWSC